MRVAFGGRHVMRESTQVRPRWRSSRLVKSGAATPCAVADTARNDGDLKRSGSGRFASASVLASLQALEAESPSSPATNRPPETLRAGSGADAATDPPSTIASNEKRRSHRDVRLDPTSTQLGAERVEARTVRLLQGAGANVTARDVRERSGVGSPLADMLLDMALTSVRSRHRQHSARVVPLRPRSSTRSLSPD